MIISHFPQGGGGGKMAQVSVELGTLSGARVYGYNVVEDYPGGGQYISEDTQFAFPINSFIFIKNIKETDCLSTGGVEILNYYQTIPLVSRAMTLTFRGVFLFIQGDGSIKLS